MIPNSVVHDNYHWYFIIITFHQKNNINRKFRNDETKNKVKYNFSILVFSMYVCYLTIWTVVYIFKQNLGYSQFFEIVISTAMDFVCICLNF